MKTDYRFIHFLPFGKQWRCMNTKGGDGLGTVEYYGPWRVWVFSADSNAVFSADCLRDIAHFLGQLKTTNNKLSHERTSEMHMPTGRYPVA